LDTDSVGGKISKKLQSLSHNKQQKGIISKLGKKTGVFRNNIMGKRVDFCSRTVISPDPLLNINQVGMPKYVAKTWYIDEMVNSYNINMFQAMVLRGTSHYPAVKHVKKRNGVKIAVSNDPQRNSQWMEIQLYLIDNLLFTEWVFLQWKL
jgi:DNA-directed RNA polymerase beta' subunit